MGQTFINGKNTYEINLGYVYLKRKTVQKDRIKDTAVQLLYIKQLFNFCALDYF